MMLNNSLRYIVAVAQTGSIREAADSLNVAQSAISRQILNIETELGTALFERHARGVVPTPAGEVFLRYARDSLKQAERVRSEVGALHGLRRGTIRICAIESVAQEVLPRALAEFATRHPGISLDVTVASTEEVIVAVQEIRADIGVAFQPQLEDDIRVLSRARFPLHALMAPDHPLGEVERLSITDTLDYPIAVTPRGSGSRMLIDATAKAAGVRLVPALESNSVHLMMRFVSKSRGITFLSRLCGAIWLRSGELTAVPLRDRLMNISSINVLALRSRALPDAAEQFGAVLQRELRRVH
jgi:DNA-binding transcriptional LysR family regulator